MNGYFVLAFVVMPIAAVVVALVWLAVWLNGRATDRERDAGR